MSRAPLLRPLHLVCDRDVVAEAARSGASPESLRRLIGRSAAPGRPEVHPASDRQPFVWNGLSAPEAAEAARLLDRADIPNLAGAATATSIYLSASRDEIRGLGSRLRGALLASTEPLLVERPRVLRCRRATLTLGARPLIMGVLNVTPDSFSDGGGYADPSRAVARAWQMVDEGADLIDVGGESTRPGAAPVTEAVELGRVLPVLSGLGPKFPLPISIDTYKDAVAREALRAGADLVNDVTGLRADPTLAGAAAEYSAPLVLSHIRGTPRTMQQEPRYGDLMAEVVGELRESVDGAMRDGSSRDSILIDPGIGFGKSFDDNLELIRRLPELGGLGHAVLVGVSRKSFIGRILDRPPLERIEGSLAAAAAARTGGASIVRVHDVAETARFFATFDSIMSGEFLRPGRS